MGSAPGGADFVSDLAGAVGRVVLVGDPSAGAVGRLENMTDGCIAKPPREEEVLARVTAALAAPAPREQGGEPRFLRLAQFTIDLGGRECRNGAGEPVTLTRAEFSLLAAFARNPGRVLSRDELNQVVTGRGAEPEDNSVYVLISRLRRKIEEDPKQPRLIVTVPGDGYKLNAPVNAGDAKDKDEAPAPAARHDAPTKGVRLSWRAIAVLIAVTAAAGFGVWMIWQDTAGFFSLGRP
jgi:DNA-binding winged helix-turn-helix (wHTH) protein